MKSKIKASFFFLSHPRFAAAIIGRFCFFYRRLKNYSFEFLVDRAQDFAPLEISQVQRLEFVLKFSRFLSQMFSKESDCKIIALVVFSFSPWGAYLVIGADQQPAFSAHAWVTYNEMNFSTLEPLDRYPEIHSFAREIRV